MPKKNEDYKKRFPTETSLDTPTFLNDPKVSAELFAYMLYKSVVYQKEGERPRTLFKKEDCNKSKMGEVLGVTRQTIGNRLNYLIERGYITFEKDLGYFINVDIENKWIDLPFKTLRYFVDVCKDQVLKVYLYLLFLQRFWSEYKHRNYNFTKEELIAHCSITRNSRRPRQEYDTVDNILMTLEKIDLIKTQPYYAPGAANARLEVTFCSDTLPENRPAPTSQKEIEAKKKGFEF